MRSLRIRLLALWLMLAVSGAATAVLLVEFYQQSTNALVSRAEDAVARSCRDLGDRYAFFVTGWRGPHQSEVDDALKRELVNVVAAALSRSPGSPVVSGIRGSVDVPSCATRPKAPHKAV
jgi:hypothetical protein